MKTVSNLNNCDRIIARLVFLCLLPLSVLTVPMHSLAQPFDAAALTESLRGADREISDRMRDAARKPVEVLQFLGLKQGMTVLDVYAAGGYYTFVMSRAVGSDGTVYAQNSPTASRYDEDRSDMTQGEALEGKIINGKLDNVVLIHQRISETGLADASVDFIMVSQILHDYYNRSPRAAHELLIELYRIVKPGGIVGIIDHTGTAENDNNRLHRMQKSQALDAATRAGFSVEAESDLLSNARDNPRRSIFDPALNRGTDQFLLRLRKPDA
ncbi:methyltransferase domain-containing protein [Gammaproteobacteria bacterium LSUCC0112]|nr:methyltransferase domain-containing protein [Gammaproteobacteria bacterium LSUCC0112]